MANTTNDDHLVPYRGDLYVNYRLRQMRLEKGISVHTLAEAADLHWSTIFAYEQLRTFPSKNKARKIAQALDCKVSDIFPKKVQQMTYDVTQERRDLLAAPRQLTSIDDVADTLSYDPADEEPPIVQAHDTMSQLYDTLETDERHVISERYFNNTFQDYKKIGREMGMTGEGVRQVELKAIEKLRIRYKELQATNTLQKLLPRQ